MKNKVKPTAAERTAYPSLYAPTYWGPCRDHDQVTDAIIENRDAFALYWKLKRFATPQLPMTRRCSGYFEVDHLELYATRLGGYVAVCSNYNNWPPPELRMLPVPPMYTLNTTSYAAHYPTLRALRQAFRAAAAELCLEP